MRLAAKTDWNQAEIVAALRNAGRTVYCTHQLGKGFPDTVCGFSGETYLLEIKRPGHEEELTDDQKKFCALWRGGPVHVVSNPLQAIEVTSGNNRNKKKH